LSNPDRETEITAATIGKVKDEPIVILRKGRKSKLLLTSKIKIKDIVYNRRKSIYEFSS
jgi:hypothetical protein